MKPHNTKKEIERSDEEARKEKEQNMYQFTQIYPNQLAELEQLEKDILNKFNLTEDNLKQLVKAETNKQTLEGLNAKIAFLYAYQNNNNIGLPPKKECIMTTFVGNVPGFEQGTEILWEELEAHREKLHAVEIGLKNRDLYFCRLLNGDTSLQEAVLNQYAKISLAKEKLEQLSDRLEAKGKWPKEAYTLGNLKWLAHQKNVNPLQVIETLYQFYTIKNLKEYSKQYVKNLKFLKQIRELARTHQSWLFTHQLGKMIPVSLEERQAELSQEDGKGLTNSENETNDKNFLMIRKLEQDLGSEFEVVAEALRKTVVGPFQLFQADVSKLKKDVSLLLAEKKHTEGYRVSALIFKMLFSSEITKLKQCKELKSENFERLEYLKELKQYIPFIADNTWARNVIPEENESYKKLDELGMGLSNIMNFEICMAIEGAQKTIKQRELIDESYELCESLFATLGEDVGKEVHGFAETSLEQKMSDGLLYIDCLLQMMSELFGTARKQFFDKVEEMRTQAEVEWNDALNNFKNRTSAIDQKEIQSKLKKSQEQQMNVKDNYLKKQFNIDELAGCDNFKGREENWNLAKQLLERFLDQLDLFLKGMKRDAQTWNNVVHQYSQGRNAEVTFDLDQAPSNHAERTLTDLNNLNQQVHNQNDNQVQTKASNKAKVPTGKLSKRMAQSLPQNPTERKKRKKPIKMRRKFNLQH